MSLLMYYIYMLLYIYNIYYVYMLTPMLCFAKV